MKIISILLVLLIFMIVKNNVTPSGLGVKEGNFKSLSSKPNGVSTQAKDSSKFVEALIFISDLETTKAEIKEACLEYGDVKIVTERDTYIHLVFTTGLMKYKDDVELYFDTTNKKIHYRSESRIGYSDMGLNKKRYDEITSNYNKLEEAN